MDAPTYLAISGGIGGAKLSLGLSKILDADEIAFAVNTGDDFEHLGLHISPDVDTLVYSLSGEANTETGWGCRDETWSFMQALERLGGETWFQLGDRDLAMHVERTRSLAVGETLTDITNDLARALGVRHRILPMSDDPVRTVVITSNGPMDFQHYFVRDQCAPVVTGFEFEGANTAMAQPEILACLASPGLKGVIICPSNPFVSIDPILAVPGLRQSLRDCAAPVIAVSPVVGGEAIKGPTVKMMRELGLPNSAVWVASHYGDFLDGFILDTLDAELSTGIEAVVPAVTHTQTVMQTLEDRLELAQSCLAFLDQLNP